MTKAAPGEPEVSGEVTPFVEKTYSVDQTADARRYFERGHARGKLVIKIAAVVTNMGELTSDEMFARPVCGRERRRAGLA